MNTNVISQSATSVAKAGQSESNWDFTASAERAMTRQVKGMTKEAWNLNRQKLIASCCADYRAHFASIYGKTERLPSAVFEKIEAAVDEQIAKRLSLIHAGNALSIRRSFAHKANDMKFVLRTTAVGEDDISLKEQHFACNLALGVARKRLEYLERKPTPDLDREKDVKEQIAKLELTLKFIEGEQSHLAELAK